MLHTPPTFIPLIDAPPDAGAPLTFIFHRGKLLLRDMDLTVPELALPASAAGLDIGAGLPHAVGVWQGRYCQAVSCDSDTVPDGHAWHGLRSLFGTAGDDFLGIAGRASQIAEWARTNRYCGVCATPMERLAGDRAYRCGACGFTRYPQICPAMMVLIRKGDHVLLALHANSPARRYTALAGFLEAGESVEDAVHREVFEEVGLRVHNLRYFSSQSWPFPNSLMIAFTADWLEGDIRTDPAEIEDARWFGPDDPWPEPPYQVSIAAALLRAHRPGRPEGAA